MQVLVLFLEVKLVVYELGIFIFSRAALYYLELYHVGMNTMCMRNQASLHHRGILRGQNKVSVLEKVATSNSLFSTCDSRSP